MANAIGLKRLAREGADVAFTYHSNADDAKKTAAEVTKLGGRAIAIEADNSDAAAITAPVERTATEFGGLDILVNNAGIALMAPIENFRLEDFDRTFAVNVRAVFVAIQAAVTQMESGGRIIMIGSCNAERMPFAGGAVYAMSKAALVGLLKGVARDLGTQGITINNVQPGPVDTDLNPANGEFAESLKKLMALPRYGHVDEVAGLVAYLAGPEAAFITGASLTIDGGFTARFTKSSPDCLRGGGLIIFTSVIYQINLRAKEDVQ